MGKLDKATTTAPYMRIKTKMDKEIKADPRYQFMFSGMLVGDTMAEFISKVFRMPGAGKPISIIDVSGVPSDITSTVVAVLSRMVFDFAIWGRHEKTRPILLVCEEAHRYVPQREERRRIERRPHPQPDRQGGPQIRHQPGPDHPAPVRPGRGRAVAMRHDHLDAAQQRPRPGLRQGGHARRGARLPRIRFPPCATANASSAARACRSRSAYHSTTSRKPSGRPRRTPASSNSGTTRAARRRQVERVVQRWRTQGN